MPQSLAERLKQPGLVVAPGEIVGLYSRLEAAVVVLVFEAPLVGGTLTLSPEATEIAKLSGATFASSGMYLATSPPRRCNRRS